MLDRKVKVIESVQRLNPNDSLITSKVNKELLGILDELDPPRHESFNSDTIVKSISENFWDYLIKLLGAFLVPLLALFTVRGDQRKDVVTGAILFCVVFGIAALAIPTMYSVWINFALMPVIQLLILLPFMIKKR